MNLIRLAFVLSAVGALTACSGRLIISDSNKPCSSSAECGLGRVCDLTTRLCVASDGPCSIARPDGDCPVGTLCLDGVCACADADTCACPAGGCVSSWCDCAPAQGCEQGACVDIVTTGPDANSCAPARPLGLCAGGVPCCESGARCCQAGEVCVADHCVPNDNACSQSIPNGWCADGLACVQGRCVQEEVCACSSANPGGCCPAGEACQGGACVVVPCSAGVPGGCATDFVCDRTTGTCEQLDCGVGHPGGFCAAPNECSVTGACLAPGVCGADGDCVAGAEYCASTTSCLDLGDCAVDADCEVAQADFFGQGYACVTGLCTQRATCVDDQDCVPDEFCSSAGNCLEPPACDGATDCGTGTFCSSIDECIPDGSCRTDADCTGDQNCASNQTCLPRTQCFVTADCPPNHACTGAAAPTPGSCTPQGPLCTTDTFTTTGCAAGELKCCPAGQTCCPDADQICSTTAGNCIDRGQCVTDADCLTPAFECVDYACLPTKDCTQCTTGETCVTVKDATGANVTGCLPAGNCVADTDCALGEQCNSSFACEASPGCATEFLDVGSAVPPNVLIVFDRSGSMQICGAGEAPKLGNNFCGYPLTSNEMMACTVTADCTNPAHVCYDFGAPIGKACTCDESASGGTVTRWEQAEAAIAQLTLDYQGRAAFGLALFPKPGRACAVNADCGAQPDAVCDTGTSQCVDACALTCNVGSCAGSLGSPTVVNTQAGTVEVPVSTTSRAAILAELAATAPGGSTPTAATLRNILALADKGGLDDLDRPNAVLLVTDGEPTGDVAAMSVCDDACGDATKNGSETDVDCGGLCAPCADAKACKVAADCSSRVCREGLCRASSCANETKDGAETDIDCGGTCGGCADSLACSVAADCRSGRCASGQCAIPTCSDGVQNGSESDVDCGGSCDDECDVGEKCVVDANCDGGVCQAGLCRPASCDDATQNNGETGVDCGGSCGACATACSNGVKDGAETDLDCGGGVCPDCDAGYACSVPGDCISDSCLTLSTGSDSTSQGARVNAAIDQLYTQEPSILAFVVGFNFATTSANLNCHAVRAKTQRRDVGACATLTRDDCAASTDTCYYDAADQASLATALDDVLNQVSSCAFDLTISPQDVNRIFVYLQATSSPFARTRQQRFVSWNYDSLRNRIEFFGSACAQLRAGTAEPIVIAGCPDSGG